MWSILPYFLLVPLMLYLTASTLYLIFLAIAFFVVREKETPCISSFSRFAVLVPAHNEELLISRLIESLLRIEYRSDYYDIYVIADNCDDKTAETAALFPIEVLVRNDPDHMGKGYAISWALSLLEYEKYDAVLMVDADSIVDSKILSELCRFIACGEKAIQCYNTVGNRSDSWFSQLLFVSRTLNNLLYHDAKYKLGLSSYLTGNGMCFSSNLLNETGWNAFSVGEDWEYYAELIEKRIKISFSKNAKVFHQESISLGQATSQRLRWSSGRFAVFRNPGIRLFLKGLRNKDWYILDSSLPLVFPNYSLQFSLIALTILLSFMLASSLLDVVFIWINVGLLVLLISLFGAGIYLSGNYAKIFKALLCAPLFLLWKSAIDLLSFTNIYKSDRWVRTKRSSPRDRDS